MKKDIYEEVAYIEGQIQIAMNSNEFNWDTTSAITDNIVWNPPGGQINGIYDYNSVATWRNPVVARLHYYDRTLTVSNDLEFGGSFQLTSTNNTISLISGQHRYPVGRNYYPL